MLTLIRQLILAAALAHHVNPAVMDRMAKCESTYNQFAVNKASGAVGLYQLLSPGELDVFYARGYNNPFDPSESANFTAEELSKGKGYLWSCY